MKQQYLVVGLGTFGASIARTLVDIGQEVLGLDIDGQIVDEMKGLLTHVAQGDATEAVVLDAIDISQFDAAVVAIGDNFEANVLTTLALKQAQVPYVMARAISPEQVRILQLIGAHQVVFPDKDAGQLAAYQVANRHVLDFLQLDENIIVAALRAGNWAGKTIRQLERETGLRTLGIYRHGGIGSAMPDDALQAGDALLAAGSAGELQALARKS